jgi:hypothetical protein
MNWLPPLLCCDGDWREVEKQIYARFKADLIDHQTTFNGYAVRLRYVEGDNDKKIPFWHLISVSEGESEEDRIPDFRRCERVGWIRAILEHANDPSLMIWEQTRKGKINIAVALQDFSYVVFLAPREPQSGSSYVMLLTAYFVEREKKRGQYRREHGDFQKTKGTQKTNAALPE